MKSELKKFFKGVCWLLVYLLTLFIPLFGPVFIGYFYIYKGNRVDLRYFAILVISLIGSIITLAVKL